MTVNSELIVLNVTRFRENSIVLHCLTKEWGRVGLMVSTKGHNSYFQPMNILEADVVENPKSQLWSLRNILLKDGLPGIRGNLYKNSMTLFLSEVLFRTLRDGANEDGLFDWCVGSILTLNALEADFSNFHIRFLLELAGALGFRPSFQDIAPFAREHLQELKPFLELDFGPSMLVPLNGASRNALCECLLQYLSYHTEQSIQVKSLAVLRDLYR